MTPCIYDHKIYKLSERSHLHFYSFITCTSKKIRKMSWIQRIIRHAKSLFASVILDCRIFNNCCITFNQKLTIKTCQLKLTKYTYTLLYSVFILFWRQNKTREGYIWILPSSVPHQSHDTLVCDDDIIDIIKFIEAYAQFRTFLPKIALFLPKIALLLSKIGLRLG